MCYAVVSFCAPSHAQPRDIPELIKEAAAFYSVSAYEMTETIRCESNFNPRAIGDSGQSLGLAQIHMPSHPYVSREQAFDPAFSIEFMAKGFKEGKQWWWTCWRNLFKAPVS